MGLFFYLAKDFNEKNGDLTMARAIQIRRGTAQQHADFTGKIGEVTMDTTNNTLRIHDGATVGGTVLAKKTEIPDLSSFDYVIEWQNPTAENNYTWYRKYKSGWVEQGGKWTGEMICSLGQEVVPTITLPIRMANTKYFVTSSVVDLYLLPMGLIREQSTFRQRLGAYQVSRTLTEFIWKVEGMAA